MGRKVYTVSQRAAVRYRPVRSKAVKQLVEMAFCDGYRAACADIRRIIQKDIDPTYRNTLVDISEFVTDYARLK